ncbi:MAG: triose-phosphate isomerase family protein [Thermodesulfobacteriota bacterium]|nr:triose-phosphate isomerase family protein [Thermodesulfobacteriota bacterium]
MSIVMTKYVLANWKAHKTMSEAEAWLEKFCQLYRPHPKVEVIIAPPALYLVPMRQKLQKYKIAHLALAAQNLSPFPPGAYTGEMAAEMVRNLVEFAILGHSERRRYFHETNQDVANKVSEAKAADIKPIVCVDQPYARSQMAALHEEYLDDLIIGYGPVEAIGIDIPQSLEKTKEEIDKIRIIAPDKPILYGGSINKENAGDYLKIAGVVGLMVGTASLDPEEFALICETASLT